MKTVLEVLESIPEFGEIAIAGDWHGQKGWGKYMIQLISESTLSPAIFHLGDFGFWPHNFGNKYLHDINSVLVKHDKYLFVTGGNHEDYIRISRMQPVPGMPGCRYDPQYPRIIVLGRGYTWEWIGKKFMSAGGANSIDRYHRTPNVDWWEGEQISVEDMHNCIKAGKVDILFAHDAPMGIDIFGSHRDPEAWPAEAIEYSNKSRLMLRRITDVVQPRLMFHGHYHMPLNLVSTMTASRASMKSHTEGASKDYTIHSRCLDKDYSGNNIGVFDIVEEKFHHISIPKPEWKFPYRHEEAWWLDDPSDKRNVWWN